MTDYSGEAAAQLGRRAEANEARAAAIPALRDRQWKAEADKLEREVRQERADITWGCIALAAIEKGLPPGCCCHGTPAEGAATP